MSSNLELKISELAHQKCCFCYKKVKELAGFEHQKDHPFILKKPICKDCWKKNDLNDKYFSSIEKIKAINQKLQNWIKSCKENRNKS